MKYIMRSSEGVNIDGEKMKCGMNEYINKMCVSNLSTLEGRIKSVSQTLGIQSNVPVFVGKNILLFPTKCRREYDCVYINYHRVLSVCKVDLECSKVVFDDLTELMVTQTQRKIKSQFSKCETLLMYINTL